MKTTKRKRRGRPALPGTIGLREPSGKPSRRLAVVDLNEREMRSVAREARQRVYHVPDDASGLPEAGSVLGRLLIFRRITQAQYDAGQTIAETYSRYYGLIGIPFPSARAQDLFRVHGMPTEGRADQARAATQAMMRIEGALGSVDGQGRPVTTITKRVCIEDSDDGLWNHHAVALLARGLDAVAKHLRGS